MLFPKTLLSLLCTAALTTSTPIEDRALITAQTIISDIKAINTGVNHARAAIAAYNGGLVSETPIVTSFAEIHVANRKGYADANLASQPFDAADSHAIVQAVINTVEKTIPAAVDDLKLKKQQFQASGQDAIIKGTLEVLLNDHDTFSAAVAAKLTSDLAAGEQAIQVIHDAIQSGIDDFSS